MRLRPEPDSGNLATIANAEEAGGGGGLVTFSGTTTLTGTRVTGNRLVGAGSRGAGIAALGGSLIVQTGSTISGNTASGQYSLGGGLYANITDDPDTSGTVQSGPPV
ncbi:hypothetical protein [Streptomyces sp. NPDC086787]|uniref:hypothetical protein n=1 Tax=Streptomyces sp. NPDC086787 TaxID=3365759 RepID=UPI00382985D0